MKLKKQHIRLLSLFVFLFGLTLHPNFAEAEHATLIYGRGGDSDTLDPARSAMSESIKVFSHIYDTLVIYGDSTSEPLPGLASSWTTSKDNLRWTFKLRSNVTFHDGTPFNSDAVRFSFLRMIDPQHLFYQEGLPYAGFFSPIKDILTPAPDTVIFVLKYPYAPFLQNLSLAAAGILSPPAMNEWGQDFGDHPVGTGPFVFAKWVENDVIVLKKNNAYWGEGPFIDTLIFKTIPKDSDRLLSLKAGAIHIMDGFSYSVINEFNKNPQLQLHQGPGLNVGYIGINTSRKPFDDVLVRQALNMAINKKRIIKLLCQGVAIPAITPLPPSEWAHNDQLTDYEYNPEEAKKLLAKVGWQSNQTVTFLQSPVSRSYMPYPEKLARYIKANLEAVGINVEIVKLPMGDFWEQAIVGNYDLISSGWTGDNSDPDNFFYSLFHSQYATPPSAMNLAWYANLELDSLLEKAQTTVDRKDRKKLYDEIQEIILFQAPWIPLAHGKVLLVARKNVKDIELIPVLPNVRLNKVRLLPE